MPADPSSPAHLSSPAAYLQDALHRWVTFVIMPVFALVNAGVAFGGASLRGDAGFVFLGIVLGLSIGKPVGVLLAVRASARFGLASRARPSGGFAVTAIVAGVGFTMALFIAQLAFPPGPLLDTAKVAVLAGSFLAAIAGLGIGRTILRPPADDRASSAAGSDEPAAASVPAERGYAAKFRGVIARA